MKFIYSIYEDHYTHLSEVRFTLVLDKTDFVIINQFRDEQFYITDKVDSFYFPEYSESLLKEGNGEFIKIRWDKNSVKPIVRDHKVVGWESPEFYFKKCAGDRSALDVLKEYADKISKIMRECKETIPEEDSSCFEKEMKIEY